MARLIYSVIASLDGYVEDEPGNLDSAAPDDEVPAAVTELERHVADAGVNRLTAQTDALVSSCARVAATSST